MDIGVDVTSISRFETVNDNFIKRVLTNIELDEFNKLNKEKKASFLATHWAVKEAIFKASQDIRYLSYTLKHDENGKPYILNHAEYKVSISHEGNLVVAFVIKLD